MIPMQSPLPMCGISFTSDPLLVIAIPISYNSCCVDLIPLQHTIIMQCW